MNIPAPIDLQMLPKVAESERSHPGLFIHGDGDATAHAALALADALNARAFETGSGEFLTAESAHSAFDTWRAYPDRVLAQHKDHR